MRSCLLIFPHIIIIITRSSTLVRIQAKIKDHVSDQHVVKSVLRLMLFNVYCLPLTALVRNYSISFHVYADDTQLYVECDKNDSSFAYDALFVCINDIKE